MIEKRSQIVQLKKRQKNLINQQNLSEDDYLTKQQYDILYEAVKSRYQFKIDDKTNENKDELENENNNLQTIDLKLKDNVIYSFLNSNSNKYANNKNIDNPNEIKKFIENVILKENDNSFLCKIKDEYSFLFIVNNKIIYFSENEYKIVINEIINKEKSKIYNNLIEKSIENIFSITSNVTANANISKKNIFNAIIELINYSGNLKSNINNNRLEIFFTDILTFNLFVETLKNKFLIKVKHV